VPEEQQVGPDQPIPPHWPHKAEHYHSQNTHKATAMWKKTYTAGATSRGAARGSSGGRAAAASAGRTTRRDGDGRGTAALVTLSGHDLIVVGAQVHS
jgi:hypothetical protein